MKKPEVLIVGAGIAGPALAYWLSQNGYRPTVVEHARQLRSGGSAIVVKGPAIPVAERMGILPQLRELATRNRSLTLLDPDGRRILQLPLTSDKAPTVEVTRADPVRGAPPVGADRGRVLVRRHGHRSRPE
ncbi:NAD(P)-binding protein [Streptomyces sp. NPDC012389]|uniref:NAD(P)-binding protein n=1 Tax=Streptomyces sp. NPDC012389 TaxID=3364830 RepID=UPI0036E09DA7